MPPLQDGVKEKTNDFQKESSCARAAVSLLCTDRNQAPFAAGLESSAPTCFCQVVLKMVCSPTPGSPVQSLFPHILATPGKNSLFSMLFHSCWQLPMKNWQSSKGFQACPPSLGFISLWNSCTQRIQGARAHFCRFPLLGIPTSPLLRKRYTFNRERASLGVLFSLSF